MHASSSVHSKSVRNYWGTQAGSATTTVMPKEILNIHTQTKLHDLSNHDSVGFLDLVCAHGHDKFRGDMGYAFIYLMSQLCCS